MAPNFKKFITSKLMRVEGYKFLHVRLVSRATSKKTRAKSKGVDKLGG